MASFFERPSVQRKAVYFGIILGLFVVNTFLWRGVSSRTTGRAPAWTVTGQAENLELRELSRGEADLTGSATRLLLTGSRGFTTTVLWMQAIEKQRRNEWNKLETLTKSLTKLQPHFLTPWLFQSWNLAYNVSVESDRVKDKYFYITRGIELLAEGERLNRNHPDMRYQLGFYYQNKFGVSDEANTLRSLFQMSCIAPIERDPGRLRPDGRNVDLDKFLQFCVQNPQLVRRLRDKLNYKSPAEIVDFLSDNRRIPSRYEELEVRDVIGSEARLKPGPEQFPILPSEVPQTSREEPTWSSALGDDFDCYQAARSWFWYAQDPLPPAEPMVAIVDKAKKMRETKKRLPRQPAEVIFRHAPARAQSYVGERLEKEGWFDESGWVVDDGQTGSGRWFPLSATEVVLGKGQNWAVNAWTRAYNLWRDHGERTGMYLTRTQLQLLEERAKAYRERDRIPAEVRGAEELDSISDPVIRESAKAHRQLFYYHQNQQMTNFAHHYYRANAERDPNTVVGRKLFFEAEKLKLAAEPDRAMAKFEEAFAIWKKVLTSYPDFRQDFSIQDDVFEHQFRYLDLVQENRGPLLRPELVVRGMLTQGAMVSGGLSIPSGALGMIYGLVTDSRSLPLPIPGPMDLPDAEGRPWLDPGIGQEVRSRLGMDQPTAAPTPSPPPGPVPEKRGAAPMTPPAKNQ